MEEELKKLQEEVNELRNELKKNQDIINQRINARMNTLEQENGDIYSDEEIVNLNLSSQAIERNVNNKLKQLQMQIDEITEFEDGKKVRIDEISKKINNRMEQLYKEGYSYSDVFIDAEIQDLQAQIEKIKEEKMLSKIELQSAKQEYQEYKKDKQKLEKEIEEIDKTEIPQHLLIEKKQLEEEIKNLKSKGKDENDPEIKEYQSDIAKINEELEKSMQKSKDKKTKLAKVIKKMGELENKYGKDKLDEPEQKKEEKSTKQTQPQQTSNEPAQQGNSTQQPQQTSNEPAQQGNGTQQPQQTSNEPAQQGNGTQQPQQASNEPVQQGNGTQQPQQPTSGPAQQGQGTKTTTIEQVQQGQENKKEYSVIFRQDGIWCDGEWTDINKIDNLNKFVENIKETMKDRDVKLKFDLRGMSLVSRVLNQCSLNREQVKQIKDFAYENRGNANIIHGLLTKQGFMVKDLINKIKKQHLFTTKEQKEVKQIAEKAESLQNDNTGKVVQIPEKTESLEDKRQNFMQQIDARDSVANSEPIQTNDSQQQSKANSFDIPLEPENTTNKDAR